MLKNLKFHLIAVSLICLIVAAIYNFMGANTPSPVAGQGSTRSIRIDSATWGLNCNPYIQSAKQAQVSAPLKKDANGQVIPGKTLQPVVLNNALESVKKLCEGKPACELYATNDTLGVDPIEGCFKKLDVHYRCFTSDRLSIIQANQGELLKLSCVSPVASDASAPPATHP